MKTIAILCSLALLAGAALPIRQDAAAEAIAKQLPSYPLDVCPVSGEKLGDDAQSFLVDGDLVRTCCGMCAKAIKTKDDERAKAIAQIEKAVVAQQTKVYPDMKCPVSDEALGSMGTPLDVVHRTRLVRLCCKGCKKEFEKTPDAFLAEVDEAMIAEQRKDYPTTECLISGEPLADPVDFLYGTRLVRLCCKSCLKPFHADPAKHLAKLDAARAKGASGEGGEPDEKKKGG